MTEEQILELVKEHFRCEEDGYGWTEFAGKPDVFLKFAQAIYEEGYEQHRKDILGEELYYD
jgi:hypothetical protein